MLQRFQQQNLRCKGFYNITFVAMIEGVDSRSMTPDLAARGRADLLKRQAGGRVAMPLNMRCFLG